MNSITSNEFIVKDTFSFAKDIVEQDISLIMGSLDVDLLFTNIPLDETINICTNALYSKQDIIQSINKEEFRNVLSLATKQFYFTFNEILYKQMHGVAMSSPLGPTSGYTFLCFFFLRKIDLRNAFLSLNLFLIEDMLMIIFFIQIN